VLPGSINKPFGLGNKKLGTELVGAPAVGARSHGKVDVSITVRRLPKCQVRVDLPFLFVRPPARYGADPVECLLRVHRCRLHHESRVGRVRASIDPSRVPLNFYVCITVGEGRSNSDGGLRCLGLADREVP